jgi:hypothetical protein
MTELTWRTPEELERTEKYMREFWRNYTLADPFTWSYAGKAAFWTSGANIFFISVFNFFYKKPWYFGEF